MKVLRHGYNYYINNKHHIVKCRNCACEFQYDSNDVYYRNSYSYIPEDIFTPCDYTATYVKCPECDEPNLLCEVLRDSEGNII